MDIQNLTNVSTVVINSLLMILKDNHIDFNSVVMQLSNNNDEAISPEVNLGELIQQTLDELRKAKAQKADVPEGFVLFPREPNQKIYRTFYDAFNSANAGNTAQCFKVAYKAMIETQEQCHD